MIGDYMNQESSKKEITDMIKQDQELMLLLNVIGVTLESLAKLEQFLY